MSNVLAVAVRTIALRDYAVSETGGVWTVRALGDTPAVEIATDSKGSAYTLLVDHICKARRVAVRAVVAELKQLEA